MQIVLRSVSSVFIRGEIFLFSPHDGKFFLLLTTLLLPCGAENRYAAVQWRCV
jgi:hypothetical protein